MSSGLDRLPGHAYAPGFEPGWFNVVFSWEHGADDVTLVVLSGTLILLVLVRLIASSPRLRNRGVRSRHVIRPESPGTRNADLAKIIARTLTDPNFAAQPKLRRAGQAAEEAES